MLLLLALLGCPEELDETETPPWEAEAFPRCADSDELRQPYFGDTHVHTALSLDANLQGTALTPDDAYRFALGEEVGIQPHDGHGDPLRTVQLERPLDWAMVSDHAEFLGTVTTCTDPEQPGYDHESCVLYRESPDIAFVTLNLGLTAQPDDVHYPALCGDDGQDCVAAAKAAWQEVQDAAEAYYDRTDSCGFTTFVGYEYSANPAGFNLHRNVVFRNDQVPELPVSYLEAPEVVELWEALSTDCIEGVEGCDALTIPHNSNLSSGLMWPGIEPETAALQAEMEPLFEVFQHKGASECWPGTTAGDELCDFEAMPYNSLSNANLDVREDPLPQDFVRHALGEGLLEEVEGRDNPYQYGIIASTDTHLGTPGLVAEDSFVGHGGAGQSNRDDMPEGLPDVVAFNPGGLAVLWAEENSREALFQAMRRREAYGTSGPRIVLRLFAGAGLDEDLCEADDFASQGYADGVPMGGALQAADGVPRFAISALSDTQPLERIQIIKGSVVDGAVVTEVFDVAGDAETTATVDTETCETEGDGYTDLCTVWTDPDFDPNTSSFYYARVLETPTCRWHAYQCAEAGITCPTEDEAWQGCCDADVQPTLQERAWSSPVWVRP